MDVILNEGLLYLQGVKFFKQKTWRKMWMVLFKPTFSGVGRLELHTMLDTDASPRKRRVMVVKTLEKIVVRLQDCLSAATAPEESCPDGCTAFYLNTLTGNYILASADTQQWLSAIWHNAFQKDPEEAGGGGFTGGNNEPMLANDIYAPWKKEPALPLNQYKVSILTTEASLRCQLLGEYVLCVNKKDLVLLELNTGTAVYKWPYTCIRKFGVVQGGFSIEAGRRCESGEGLFIFESPHGNEIYQTIVDNCSSERKSSSEPPGIHADRSPAPATRRHTGPSSCKPAEALDSSKVTAEYATVTFKERQPPSVVQYSTAGEEVLHLDSSEEDQLCRSMGAAHLESTAEAGIYHNWKKSKCPNPQLASASHSPADAQYPPPAGNGYGVLDWVDAELEGSGGPSICAPSQSMRNRLTKMIFKGQAERQ